MNFPPVVLWKLYRFGRLSQSMAKGWQNCFALAAWGDKESAGPHQGGRMSASAKPPLAKTQSGADRDFAADGGMGSTLSQPRPDPAAIADGRSEH
jgi:hypothetical protein